MPAPPNNHVNMPAPAAVEAEQNAIDLTSDNMDVFVQELSKLQQKNIPEHEVTPINIQINNISNMPKNDYYLRLDRNGNTYFCLGKFDHAEEQFIKGLTVYLHTDDNKVVTISSTNIQRFSPFLFVENTGVGGRRYKKSRHHKKAKRSKRTRRHKQTKK